MKQKIITVVILLALLMISGGISNAQELTGNDILAKMEEVRDITTGKLKLKMELYNAAGKKRMRKLRSWSMDQGQDKSLIRFLEPADVEGTGFLSLDNKSGDEDMYLYLPAVNLVRKISGSQKNGSFVGTDFSYNDLAIIGSGSYQDDYQATIVEENDKNYVLKIVPTDDDIEYKYGQLVVSKSNWYPKEAKFYDQQGELYKVLKNSQIEKVDGYWTTRKVVMKDVQTGSKTIVYLEEITYDQGVNERIFTTRYLKRY